MMIDFLECHSSVDKLEKSPDSGSGAPKGDCRFDPYSRSVATNVRSIRIGKSPRVQFLNVLVQGETGWMPFVVSLVNGKKLMQCFPRGPVNTDGDRMRFDSSLENSVKAVRFGR
jgi:hypothetical protein